MKTISILFLTIGLTQVAWGGLSCGNDELLVQAVHIGATPFSGSQPAALVIWQDQAFQVITGEMNVGHTRVGINYSYKDTNGTYAPFHVKVTETYDGFQFCGRGTCPDPVIVTTYTGYLSDKNGEVHELECVATL